MADITAAHLERAMARNFQLVDELRKTEPAARLRIYAAALEHIRSTCPELFMALDVKP